MAALKAAFHFSYQGCFSGKQQYRDLLNTFWELKVKLDVAHCKIQCEALKVGVLIVLLYIASDDSCSIQMLHN